MNLPLDDRIPVRLAASVAVEAADCLVLIDAAAPVAASATAIAVAFRPGPDRHARSCACCGGRTPLAALLTRLFIERGRGERAFFRQVVAVSDQVGLQAAREALATDPLLIARYRDDGQLIARYRDDGPLNRPSPIAAA